MLDSGSLAYFQEETDYLSGNAIEVFPVDTHMHIQDGLSAAARAVNGYYTHYCADVRVSCDARSILAALSYTYTSVACSV